MTCQFRSMFVLPSSDTVFHIPKLHQRTKWLSNLTLCRTSITGAIFRGASCRGIRKKGEQTEALACSKENKDDCNKITIVLILLPILLHKKSVLKYVGVIIFILGTKNKAVNKLGKKTKKKVFLFIRRFINSKITYYSHHCNRHILYEE